MDVDRFMRDSELETEQKVTDGAELLGNIVHSFCFPKVLCGMTNGTLLFLLLESGLCQLNV